MTTTKAGPQSVARLQRRKPKRSPKRLRGGNGLGRTVNPRNIRHHHCKPTQVARHRPWRIRPYRLRQSHAWRADPNCDAETQAFQRRLPRWRTVDRTYRNEQSELFETSASRRYVLAAVPVAVSPSERRDTPIQGNVGSDRFARRAVRELRFVRPSPATRKHEQRRRENQDDSAAAGVDHGLTVTRPTPRPVNPNACAPATDTSTIRPRT